MGPQFGEVALYKPRFVGIGGIQMGLWWFMKWLCWWITEVHHSQSKNSAFYKQHFCLSSACCRTQSRSCDEDRKVFKTDRTDFFECQFNVFHCWYSFLLGNDLFSSHTFLILFTLAHPFPPVATYHTIPHHTVSYPRVPYHVISCFAQLYFHLQSLPRNCCCNWTAGQNKRRLVLNGLRTGAAGLTRQ